MFVQYYTNYNSDQQFSFAQIRQNGFRHVNNLYGINSQGQMAVLLACILSSVPVARFVSYGCPLNWSTEYLLTDVPTSGAFIGCVDLYNVLTLGVAVGADEEALVRVLAVGLQPQLASSARIHFSLCHGAAAILLLFHHLRLAATLRFC